MNKIQVLSGLIIFLNLFMGLTSNCAAVPWVKLSNGINENEMRCVSMHPYVQGLIFIGTERAAYRSDNGGRTFSSLWSGGAFQGGVNAFSFSYNQEDILYMATDAGAFLSLNSGGHWQKIFEAQDALSGYVLDILEWEGRIYLATLNGLFIKNGHESDWQKAAGYLGSRPVFVLKKGVNGIFAATQAHVYRVDSEGREEAVFQMGQNGLDGLESEYRSEEPEDVEFLRQEGKIKAIALDESVFPGRILLATSQGIYEGDIEAWEWSRVADTGLLSQTVTALAAFYPPQFISQPGTGPNVPLSNPSHGRRVFPEQEIYASPGNLRIFAGTDQGVYELIRGQWSALFQGLETGKINALEYDGQGNLYAATARGLFLNPLGEASTYAIEGNHDAISEIQYKNALQQLKKEPAVQDVQAQAVDYAEVHPDKIKDWRKRAGKQAWLPSVRFGVAVDKNLTRGDSIWGSYTNGGQFCIGPDDKTFYDNASYDLSLSWDLSELIWNSDQASIDSRSKLMVELRGSILDQVTRLYFERRRLQVELAKGLMNAREGGFEKNMRVEELTALLDALTGGWFSKQLQ